MIAPQNKAQIYSQNPVTSQYDNNIRESFSSEGPVSNQRADIQPRSQASDIPLYRNQNNTLQLASPTLQQQPQQQFNSVRNYPQPHTTTNQYNANYSPGIEDKKAALAEKNSLSTHSLPNPIYNPIPHMMNNPYILKQFQSKANIQPNQYPSYFANVANSNLTKY